MISDAGGKILVVGCGYLGQAVAARLMRRGLGVVALTRNPETAATLAAMGVPTTVAELAGTDWHRQVPAGITGAVNCVSAGGGGLEGYRRSYVEGMASLVSWLQLRPEVGTVVYTGSTSVYPGSGGSMVDETAPVGGGERPRLLLEAEQRLLTAPGIRRACVLRLAGLYGPGRDHLVEQVRTGTVSGHPETHLNLIHRDDAAAAVEAALLAAAGVAGGVFNVADEGRATRGEVVTWLAQRLGLPPPIFTGGDGLRREGPAPDRIILSSRARAVLGWRPLFPSFREGYAGFVSP